MRNLLKAVIQGQVPVACLVTASSSGVMQAVKKAFVKVGRGQETGVYDVSEGMHNVGDVRSLVSRIQATAGSSEQKVGVFVDDALRVPQVCLLALIQALEYQTNVVVIFALPFLSPKLSCLTSRACIVQCPSFLSRPMVKSELGKQGVSAETVDEFYDGTVLSTLSKVTLAEKCREIHRLLSGDRQAFSKLLSEDRLVSSDALVKVLQGYPTFLCHFLKRGDTPIRRVVLAATVRDAGHERL